MTRLNFCNPVVYFSSKTETGVAQFTPADVLCYFSNKEGLLHTLTELLLSVILPDFPLHSSRLNYVSPQSILGVYLVIISSSSLHSFTRDIISSQIISLTCTLRPRPSLPITCLQFPFTFMSARTAQSDVTSNARFITSIRARYVTDNLSYNS